MFVHQVLWLSVELENTVRVFLTSLVLESLGRLSQAKCLVTTASALSFLKEVTKRWIRGRSGRLGLLIHQFIFQTNAEDHRKPGRVLGSQPEGKSYHWPKFSCKRWSISVAQNRFPQFSSVLRGAEGQKDAEDGKATLLLCILCLTARKLGCL